MRIHTHLLKDPAPQQMFKEWQLSLEMNARKGGLCVSATAHVICTLVLLEAAEAKPPTGVNLGLYELVSWFIIG